MAYRSPVLNFFHDTGDIIVENLLTEKEVSKIGLSASSLHRKRWEGGGLKYTKFDHAVRHQHLDNWAHITTCKRVLNFSTLPVHGGSQ